MASAIYKKQSLLSRYIANRNGNFGIMTALILPVALATAGVAMDLTRLVQVKSELQNAADSAALAAASALSGKGISNAEAIALAKAFLASQMANLTSSGNDVEAQEQAQTDLEGATLVTVEKTVTGANARTYDVSVNAHYDLALNGMTQLLGYKTVTLNVVSKTQSSTESKNALSMFLVLDRSGSMAEDTETVNAANPTKTESYNCDGYWNGWRWVYNTCYRQIPNYVTKIEALKTAVADLTTQLDSVDPDKIYVRTAAVSYNSDMQSPTSLEWGTAKALKYVNALTATGGTDSSDAMSTADSKIRAASENAAHLAKNGQTSPGKFIVFMTDGDNNYTSADTNTKKTCDAAKAKGVEIYTVALMAPSKGQALLEYCATDDDHYYNASDGVELVAAFKEIGEKAASAMTRLTN